MPGHRNSKIDSDRQRRTRRLSFEGLERRDLLASLSVASATAAPGQMVTLPITINEADQALAFDLTIQYDTDLLDLTTGDLATGGIVSDWLLTPNLDEGSGTLGIVLSGITPIDGRGELMTLTFLVTNEATGVANVDLSFAQINEVGVSSEDLLDGEVAIASMTIDSRIDVSLVQVPTLADEGDEVDSLPSGAEWIDEWTPFWLEVWARTEQADGIGIDRVRIDVAVNADYFVPARIESGSAFDNGLSSFVHNDQQRIELTAERTSVEAVGDGRYVLAARIFFQPVQEGPGVVLDIDSNDPIAAVTESWIGPLDGIRSEVRTDSLAHATEVQVGGDPATELWPLLYDLDDDGRIGFGDLSLFSAAFLKEVGNGPGTGKSDFDHSGSVGFSDFSLFSANFLLTRKSTSLMTYPDNFPDAWRVAPELLSSSRISNTSDLPHAGLESGGFVLLSSWDFSSPNLSTGSIAKKDSEGTLLNVEPTRTVGDAAVDAVISNWADSDERKDVWDDSKKTVDENNRISSAVNLQFSENDGL